jgi:hypothetical protein
VSRRSDTPGAKLHITFTNGKTEQVMVVTPPAMSAYARPQTRAELEDQQTQANAYRAAVYEHQVHNSVTARSGLLLQNGGATTAEDLLIEISIPERLQISFLEREPPPKAVRKTPIVPIEPSPRSWHLDSDTKAHCRVLRVTSSVGLPLIFLTLRDSKDSGSFVLDVKVTATQPPVEQTSHLTLQFVPATPG